MNEKYELMNDKKECSFLENETDDECLLYEDGTCGDCLFTVEETLIFAG